MAYSSIIAAKGDEPTQAQYVAASQAYGRMQARRTQRLANLALALDACDIDDEAQACLTLAGAEIASWRLVLADAQHRSHARRNEARPL